MSKALTLASRIAASLAIDSKNDGLQELESSQRGTFFHLPNQDVQPLQYSPPPPPLPPPGGVMVASHGTDSSGTGQSKVVELHCGGLSGGGIKIKGAARGGL